MKKIRVLVLLIIFLVAGAAIARDESFVINLKTSDTGEALQAGDLEWPNWIHEKIQAANNNEGQFFVEISNDPTEWKIVQWVKAQPKTDDINANDMNLVCDMALDVLRLRNVGRVMADIGLTNLDLAHSFVPADSVYIKISYKAYPEVKTVNTRFVPADSGNDDANKSLQHIYDLINAKANQLKSSDWALALGLEGAFVSDGRPIIVPTASIVRLKGKTMLMATGGFWSKDDFDHKYASLWLAHFPKNPSLGFVLQASYASQVLADGNGYVQQGYGPMFGLILRDDKLSVHLIGGFQYFDRLNQDRRLEPAFNLGVNFGVFSF